MTWFLILSIGIYALLILVFSVGFFRLKTFTPEKSISKTAFSVIIPFRNEAQNLPALMQSLSALKYPAGLTEFLFVDDESEDDSVKIIKQFIAENKEYNWVVLKNERKTLSPKKDAISSAVSKAKNNWILTTDADCILPENTLKHLAAFIAKKSSKMIAAPVLALPKEENFMVNYQFLESLILAGVTMGSFGINNPIMCNGAHLAYEKTAFKSVNGFEGNAHIASGDDLFLLEKMNRAYPKQVHFLKNRQHIIFTKTENSWASLINQRIRWAAKAPGYKNVFSKLTGLIVLSANVSLIIAYIGVFKSGTGLFFVILILIKWMADEIFIYQANRFFKQKIRRMHLRMMTLVYPFLTVYITAKALLGHYKWKGRVFKK